MKGSATRRVPALRMGAGNILLERWATEKSVAETVERFAPTVLLSVPAVYHRLLEAGLPQTPPFRALRHYVSAGERMPPQIWNAWEAASDHPILDGLGCSELVYMVIGNTPRLSLSVFAPQYTMAAVIANEFSEAADDLYLHALIEIGLLLFIITLLVNGVSRLLIWRMGRQSSGMARPAA